MGIQEQQMGIQDRARPLAPGSQAPVEHETSSSDSSGSWAVAQGSGIAPGTLVRDHKRLGTQRVRLRSNLVSRLDLGGNASNESNGNGSAGVPAPGHDPREDFPGVDLATGKVTDKGVFESVEARQQFIDMAEETMGRKYDPKMLACGGQIKIMWCPDEPVFINVTERRRVPMALLDSVLQPNETDPDFLLREACKTGEAYEVIRQVAGGADVNHSDPQFSEYTPLHWACWYGHTDVVRVLLGRLGAYPYPLDRAGKTPWHHAMNTRNYALVRELHALGAAFPVMVSMIPLNASAADAPFECQNEYFNPAFPNSTLWRTYNLRHVTGCFDSQLLPATVEAFQPDHGLGPAQGVWDRGHDAAGAAAMEAAEGDVYVAEKAGEEHVREVRMWWDTQEARLEALAREGVAARDPRERERDQDHHMGIQDHQMGFQVDAGAREEVVDAKGPGLAGSVPCGGRGEGPGGGDGGGGREGAGFEAGDAAVDEVADNREPGRDADGRIYLNCPFRDKERCKEAGGRWDMKAKQWYVPDNRDAGPFRAWWPPLPPLPPPGIGDDSQGACSDKSAQACEMPGAEEAEKGAGDSDVCEEEQKRQNDDEVTRTHLILDHDRNGAAGRQRGDAGGCDRDMVFEYEREELKEEYREELDRLEPQTWAQRMRMKHPTQESWVEDYYEKWLSTPEGRETLEYTKNHLDALDPEDLLFFDPKSTPNLDPTQYKEEVRRKIEQLQAWWQEVQRNPDEHALLEMNDELHEQLEAAGE